MIVAQLSNRAEKRGRQSEEYMMKEDRLVDEIVVVAQAREPCVMANFQDFRIHSLVALHRLFLLHLSTSR